MTVFVKNLNKKLVEDKFCKQKPETLTTNSILTDVINNSITMTYLGCIDIRGTL